MSTEQKLHGPHGELIEQKLEAANKRIDKLEEMVYGLHIALRGLAHRGAELKQQFDESHCTSDKEHLDNIICALKMCYPDD